MFTVSPSDCFAIVSLSFCSSNRICDNNPEICKFDCAMLLLTVSPMCRISGIVDGLQARQQQSRRPLQPPPIKIASVWTIHNKVVGIQQTLNL